MELVRDVPVYITIVLVLATEMSWLSDGLSSLTGQITTFTKDVISETTEEVEGEVLPYPSRYSIWCGIIGISYHVIVLLLIVHVEIQLVMGTYITKELYLQI